MRKRSINNVVDYILNSHHLGKTIKLADLIYELELARPRELKLSSEEWDELDDINSDAYYEVECNIVRKVDTRLNSTIKRLEGVFVEPSPLSVSSYTNNLGNYSGLKNS